MCPHQELTETTRPIHSAAMSQVPKVRCSASTGARSALCSSGEGLTGGRATHPSSSQEGPLLPLAAAAITIAARWGRRRGAAAEGLPAARTAGPSCRCRRWCCRLAAGRAASLPAAARTVDDCAWRATAIIAGQRLPVAKGGRAAGFVSRQRPGPLRVVCDHAHTRFSSCDAD